MFYEMTLSTVKEEARHCVLRQQKTSLHRNALFRLACRGGKGRGSNGVFRASEGVQLE